MAEAMLPIEAEVREHEERDQRRPVLEGNVDRGQPELVDARGDHTEDDAVRRGLRERMTHRDHERDQTAAPGIVPPAQQDREHLREDREEDDRQDCRRHTVRQELQEPPELRETEIDLHPRSLPLRPSRSITLSDGVASAASRREM